MRRRAHVDRMIALLAATGIAACSSRDIRDAAIDTASPPPRTLTFVIDRLDIDPSDDPSVPHTGFDLDGLFSTVDDLGGCSYQDYFSGYDTDQNCANVANERCQSNPNPGCAAGDSDCRGGVDNQLPMIANLVLRNSNTDMRAALLDNVAHNELVLLVRITGIDDLVDDGAVRVAFYRAFPRFTDSCDRVDPGREYSIDRSFLVAGGDDIDRDARIAVDGSIVAGRLRMRSPTPSRAFELPIDTSTFRLVLPLRALVFRANVSANALDRGSLGAYALALEMIDASDIICKLCPDRPEMVRAVASLVDIRVDGTCDVSDSNPPTYGGISVGLDVHAVPAIVSTSTPIDDARPIGACGAAASDAGQGG